MEPWMTTLITLLVSLIGGGLAGGIYTHWVSTRDATRKAEEKETTTIAVLRGEVQHVRHLCVYNAGLKDDKIAPFVRLPSVVLTRATFEESHTLPRLAGMQRDLRLLTIGVSQVNQLIDLHELMWIAPEVNSTYPQGATVERRQVLQLKICKICADEEELAVFDPSRSTYLRTLADRVLYDIGKSEGAALRPKHTSVLQMILRRTSRKSTENRER